MSAPDLSRRAVACVPLKRWPDFTPVLLPDGERGIVSSFQWRGGRIKFVRPIDGGGDWHFDGSGSGDPSGAIPMLDTPAGLGCLLAMVREAWGHQDLSVWPNIGIERWVAWLPPSRENAIWDEVGIGATEAAALVAALEAAPVRP